MWISAPAWLRKVAVKLMPNFTGVNARPFFRIGLLALNSRISAGRLAYSALASSSAVISSMRLCSTVW
ncbi:hypothetical protein D3C81_1482880 [compost metagenome]